MVGCSRLRRFDTMNPKLSNWKWACIGATLLTILAMFVVFTLHPGGFESQGAWLFLLLPGTIAAYPIADYLHHAAPRAEPAMFWSLTLGFNFVWYFLVTYVVIKIRNFFAGGD